MTSVVEWTEPQDDDFGVDHLGMRVAGERAYSALFDFTTTVTWRPRYLSYLSWSLRRAWHLVGGGGEPSSEIQIDRNSWRQIIKRCDYVLAAATLSIEREAEHIAGSIKLKKALDAIGHDPAARLPVAANHLVARTGSHEVYLGVLRGLGLVMSAHGVDVPSGRGEALADAFQACLEQSGTVAIFEADAVPREHLERVGYVCGLSRLAPSADLPPEVDAERREIREQILDWGRFDAGRGATAQRVLSIGLLLAIFRLFGDRVTLNRFREVVLLDAALLDDGIVFLDLPPVYDEVRTRWRCYQAHAYATYALEALLGVVLARAFAWQGEREGVPYSALLDDVVHAVTEVGASDIDHALTGWPDRTLEDTMDALDALVQAGRAAPRLEPELHHDISLTVWQGDAEDHDLWAYRAALLLLLSIARLRHLTRDNPAAWSGDNDPQRFPPRRLIDHVDASIAAGRRTSEYLRIVLHELVVWQHRRNVLRKLAADPRKFTAKLLIERGLLVPLIPHHPGTSNPRFENAVVFLQDLGYLTLNEPVTVTADGDALMAEIGRRTGS